MLQKPSFCENCPITNFTRGYVPLEKGTGTTLIVGEAAGDTEADTGRPFCGGSGSWLNNLLRSAGIKRDELSIINTIGCQPIDNVYPTDKKWHHTSRANAYAAVDYCAQHHLWPGIRAVNPSKIIALGDQALTATTNRKGIMVWRGSPLPLKGDNNSLKVIPTLHPAFLMRQAGMTSIVISDLRKSLDPVPEYYELFANHDILSNFNSTVFAFDFEWDYNEDITICGISDRLYSAITGSFHPYNEEWRRIFEGATDLIGHNIIGADTRYFDKMGWQVNARMHDTMLKQHLVQPDFRHGLGFVASIFTNKVFWKGRGKEEEDSDGNLVDTKTQYKTWNQPDAIPRNLGGYGGCVSEDEAYRLYNARDTDGSFQINQHLDLLLEKWDLTNVYWNVSLPINYICRDINEHGIAINSSKAKEIRQELGDEIDELERTLPEGLAAQIIPITRSIPAPTGTYKPRGKKCKGNKKDGTSHEPIELTFQIYGQPIECPQCHILVEAPKLTKIKKIKVPSSKKIQPWNSSQKVMAYAKNLGLKVYINRKRGTAAADVNARKGWGRTHPEFRIIDRLKDLGTERNNFAKQELGNVDRLFPLLQPWGTSEGRFSSKGKREGIDPNIQNQPDSIRKIYIPDKPNWSFIELDYASGENFLTAHLAKDYSRLERLRTPGYSEHLDLARQIFSCPDLTKSKDDIREFWGQTLSGYLCYDIGKHANHGRNYGMTHVKLREYMEMSGIFFTEKQCKDIMAACKAMCPETARWQDETIERAKKDGFLRNVFGRIRWFSSRDVATKSLAFLPASTLADIIIRAMIGHYPTHFPNEVAALGLTAIQEFEPSWAITTQIHDSLLMQGPDEGWQRQIQKSQTVMTQPWKELDGFSLGVGLKYGGPGISWGEMKEVELG